MSNLPSPGPGRPHHPSYSEVGLLVSVGDFLVFISVVCVLALIFG
jgi:hypothetical protein